MTAETSNLAALTTVWWADSHLARRWLAQHLAEFAAVTVVSPPDHDFYRRLAPMAALHLAANGVDLPPLPRYDPGGARAVFVGYLDSPHGCLRRRLLKLSVTRGRDCY